MIGVCGKERREEGGGRSKGMTRGAGRCHEQLTYFYIQPPPTDESGAVSEAIGVCLTREQSRGRRGEARDE